MNYFTEDPKKLLTERIAGFLLGIGVGTAIGFLLRQAGPAGPAAVTPRREEPGSGRP